MLNKGMKRKQRSILDGVLFLVGGLIGALAPTAASAARPRCEEQCLRGIMDDYLSAMLAHDSKRLPVTSDVRFTENGVAILLGQGLWWTASGPIQHKIYVPDPQSQTIGFMGALKENENTVYFSARLKLRDEKIAEAETMVARGSMVAKEVVPARDSLAELTQVSDRLPRAKLIELSGKYFDAFTNNDGNAAPFSPRCDRVENGMQVTNIAPQPGQLPMDCATGLTVMPPIASASHRRILAVDETRNLVLWAAVFDITGIVTPKFEAWRKNAPPPMLEMLKQVFTPNSGPLMELFRIRDGKIAEIEAVFYPHQLPYGFTTGWNDQ